MLILDHTPASDVLTAVLSHFDSANFGMSNNYGGMWNMTIYLLNITMSLFVVSFHHSLCIYMFIFWFSCKWSLWIVIAVKIWQKVRNPRFVTIRMLNLACSWKNLQWPHLTLCAEGGPGHLGLEIPVVKGYTPGEWTHGCRGQATGIPAVRIYLWGFEKEAVDQWKSFRADLILKRSLETHISPPFIGWGGNQESKHQQLSTNPGQSVNDSSSCINPFNCRHLIDWIY